MTQILIVEDNGDYAADMAEFLAELNHEVEIATTAGEMWAALTRTPAAVVVLDLGLPLKDGIEVLRSLRARKNTTPILVLTARDAVPDRIVGLDCGADDYVVKPVDLHELGARLRSLVRRAHGQVQDSLRCGALLIEPAARRVSLDGADVSLSTREFDLLHALMLNAGRVMSREQLEQQMYSWGYEVESNAIEVHIHHLRRKLSPDLIQTVRGIGYTLLREQALP